MARKLELDGREEGQLWLQVKLGLHNHEAKIREAYEAGTYEMKSAILSDVARSIADDLSAALQPWSVVREAQKTMKPQPPPSEPLGGE